MEITPRHWLIALLIASLTHAALALALVQLSTPPPIAPAGITIELGDGGLSAAAGADGDGSPPGSAVLQPVASPAPAASPMAAASEDQTQLAIDAERAHEQEAVLPPVATVETVAAKPLPEPEPEPEPKQKPEPEPEPQADPQPTPTSARVATPQRVKPEQKPKATQDRPGIAATKANPERPDKAAARARSGSGDGNAESSEAGAIGHGKGGRNGSGSGNDGQANASNYYGRLATWLTRHKRYPAQARRLRQEGTVKVTFTITRSGRVVSKRIIQSSGYELLDQEVQAMLERASPMPRIPSSLGRSSLTITVPVAFTLH
ncbi:MAG: energy transducer TonB [Chromatiaceae bacterium]|nr:energy transducer TonB [Chromatiaceae bacterium]